MTAAARRRRGSSRADRADARGRGQALGPGTAQDVGQGQRDGRRRHDRPDATGGHHQVRRRVGRELGRRRDQSGERGASRRHPQGGTVAGRVAPRRDRSSRSRSRSRCRSAATVVQARIGRRPRRRGRPARARRTGTIATSTPCGLRRAGRDAAARKPAVVADLDELHPAVEHVGERGRGRPERAPAVVDGRGQRREQVAQRRPGRTRPGGRGQQRRAGRGRRGHRRRRRLRAIAPARTTRRSGRRLAAAATMAASSVSAPLVGPRRIAARRRGRRQSHGFEEVRDMASGSVASTLPRRSASRGGRGRDERRERPFRGGHHGHPASGRRADRHGRQQVGALGIDAAAWRARSGSAAASRASRGAPPHRIGTARAATAEPSRRQRARSGRSARPPGRSAAVDGDEGARVAPHRAMLPGAARAAGVVAVRRPRSASSSSSSSRSISASIPASSARISLADGARRRTGPAGPDRRTASRARRAAGTAGWPRGNGRRARSGRAAGSPGRPPRPAPRAARRSVRAVLVIAGTSDDGAWRLGVECRGERLVGRAPRRAKITCSMVGRRAARRGPPSTVIRAASSSGKPPTPVPSAGNATLVAPSSRARAIALRTARLDRGAARAAIAIERDGVDDDLQPRGVPAGVTTASPSATGAWRTAANSISSPPARLIAPATPVDIQSDVVARLHDRVDLEVADVAVPELDARHFDLRSVSVRSPTGRRGMVHPGQPAGHAVTTSYGSWCAPAPGPRR